MDLEIKAKDSRSDNPLKVTGHFVMTKSHIEFERGLDSDPVLCARKQQLCDFLRKFLFLGDIDFISELADRNTIT